MGWPVVEKNEALGDVGPGWSALIGYLYKKKPDYIDVVQVKEKFGGLRFYFEPWDDSYAETVRWAENESYKICEQCGKPGTMDDAFPWIRTLCEEDKKRRKEEKNATTTV